MNSRADACSSCGSGAGGRDIVPTWPPISLPETDVNRRFVTMAALAIWASSVILTGCSRKNEGPATTYITLSAVDSEGAADTIYLGGDIVTMNDAQPTAESIAVKDGKAFHARTP
jgi:hypothetical protein